MLSETVVVLNTTTPTQIAHRIWYDIQQIDETDTYADGRTIEKLQTDYNQRYVGKHEVSS